MSNVKQIKRKSVKLNLGDGIDRELKITLNAMAELEDKYGSVEAAFDKLQEGSIKAVRFVLWAALLHDKEHPITEDQIGDLIDTDNINTIMTKLTETVAEDMPSDDADVVPMPAVQGTVVSDPN